MSPTICYSYMQTTRADVMRDKGRRCNIQKAIMLW